MDLHSSSAMAILDVRVGMKAAAKRNHISVGFKSSNNSGVG